MWNWRVWFAKDQIPVEFLLFDIPSSKPFIQPQPAMSDATFNGRAAAARGSWSMHPPAAVKVGVLQKGCFFDILPSGKLSDFP